MVLYFHPVLVELYSGSFFTLSAVWTFALINTNRTLHLILVGSLCIKSIPGSGIERAASGLLEVCV